MINNDPKTRTIGDFAAIGFCQKKFYKVSVWNKAMKAMKVLVDEGYAVPFDYGRGKGKFNKTPKATGLSYADLGKIVDNKLNIKNV